jgi:glycosyltransferase involved in cell wall biosynthesis
MVPMATALKVLMLVENASWPGDQRVKNEAAALREHGFQVAIICPKMPSRSQHQESYLRVDNMHVYRYSLPRTANKYTAYLIEYSFALLKTFWLSLRVLFRHGFDVIHAANPPDLFFTIGLFYRPFGKKIIFDQHDLAPELFKVKFNNRMKLLQQFQLFFERFSYQTADLVLVTNLSQKKKAIDRGGCAAEKVVVVRNGPDLERMKLVQAEPQLKSGRRYLLAYVGEMAVQDGVDYALYALDWLVHTCGRRDVSLVLMGDGQHASALRVLAHELQLDEYARFTGWVNGDELVRYLATADIGLVPDPQNGLNEFSTLVKTMEYMAMKKPIVAFDLQETRFSAQDSALYATPNSVEEFANNIASLLDDEALRARMGAIGYRRVVGELSWDHAKKNLWRAYEIVCKMHQGPLALPHPQTDPQELTPTITPNEKTLKW